jgi:hypothetical protein
MFAGCLSGEKTVRVTGQLEKDGKPYTANLAGKEPDTFAVDFVGDVNGNSYIFPATISPNGSFNVDGTNGHGIPPGEYKITVLHSGYMGAGGDRFGARFAAEKTPLAVKIDKNTHLKIDVGAGSLTQ